MSSTSRLLTPLTRVACLPYRQTNDSPREEVDDDDESKKGNRLFSCELRSSRKTYTEEAEEEGEEEKKTL